MGIFDWWIDKTIKETASKRLEERLPALIDAEVDRQCKERGIKLVRKQSDE